MHKAGAEIPPLFFMFQLKIQKFFQSIAAIAKKCYNTLKSEAFRLVYMPVMAYLENIMDKRVGTDEYF